MNFFMTKPMYNVQPQAYFPSGHFAGKQGNAYTGLALPIPHKKAGTNHLIHHPLRRNFGAQSPQS
jgi:hypothetical protein